ncbi:hypothetical protein BS47DRAFT_1366319 [Hydnum rufescens UP504]|uniref:Uncharacterized protein n=1 Tax=Hydnum rufescens UP504 TaxID=1448309 RepID=A0A9P6DNH3_9AGAM|nr:hypothetical protein BS47DRAFT_1366319 [Hydnum rufescens UP504]
MPHRRIEGLESEGKGRNPKDRKQIQGIPCLELTAEGKKALAWGEFWPFRGNHQHLVIKILVKMVKVELDQVMEAAQHVHNDLEEMMTEGEKSEGKVQLEELTKMIGWLKGEMQWNHLWHLNVWDLGEADESDRSTLVNELPGGHDLCTPIT